ncbi:hypothetical protein Cgig2_025561 [Carnegiea gigantea]|uniref:Retrotransposon Copia-like N-terminal domain-containing protein n=1 Tax=Carnegiea gigantea TaxID=171969 RepID=A0A9Q1JR03_9CARY|nr:hypothetical protein Cgig2_025561 [Carnegiea gigantea]
MSTYFQNPLFLYPSEGPNSLVIQEKLIITKNYRSWRRNMEIALATKRKLRFVQLKQRFSLSNGSRKYNINKEIYEVKQNNSSVSEYYTKLKCLREDSEGMNELPKISAVIDEITTFLKAFIKQKEEQKLFQFLNVLRLMFTDSTRREPEGDFRNGNLEIEPTALIAEMEIQRVVVNVVTKDIPERNVAKKFPQKKPDKNQAYKGKFKGTNEGKIVANANAKTNRQSGDASLTQSHIKQLRQFLKSLPQNNEKCGAEIDEELDTNFVGMILCTHAGLNNVEWIIDSGATDHMTYKSGTIKLSTEIVLKNVLYVPVFKYDLLSVPKLTKDSRCMDYVTMRISGVGREHRGLYFLKDQPLHGVDNTLECIIERLLETDKDKLRVAGAADCPQVSGSYEVWHKRLGHAPFNKLKHLSNIHFRGGENKVCVNYPMAKLTRQPFQPSSSRSSSICQPIHMDIWGSNRTPTHKNFRYFLALVDDCTRSTWLYLSKNRKHCLHFKSS